MPEVEETASRRHDEAFAAPDEAVAGDEPHGVALASDPGWDPLRDDPRWEPLLGRAGFPEEVILRSRELYQRRRAADVELRLPK